ncbi:MAG: Mov34/MPN/PAD-1 family protein [Candidatus Diapherotrites archaeon]
MLCIKKAIVEGILEASKNTYPNEFFALLGSKNRNEIIDEVVIVPAVFGREHAIVRGRLPVDFRIVGSVHSHPSPDNNPSQEDLVAFSRFGKVHFIISYPFNIGNINVVDSSGKKIEWTVV